MPVALYCLVVAICSTAAAQQPGDRPKEGKPKDRFLRLVRDKDDAPLAVETAIVHCAPVEGRRGPTVDLVAAVHVAEKSYYDRLNKEFGAYDAVLYELVAPEGTRVPKGGGKGSGSFVSMVQKAMKDMLQLEYQLEVIDYTRKNMVHADMSPEQVTKAMRERGESVWTILLRMMGYALARQSQPGRSSDADLLLALFDKNRALALKRVLAEQIEDMEGSLMAIEGPEGSTIISGRNKAALAVLRQQIAAGKQKIAIFYGAGHMPDLQQRLRDEFGLAPVSTRWLVAWDMKPKPKTTPAKPKAAQ